MAQTAATQINLISHGRCDFLKISRSQHVLKMVAIPLLSGVSGVSYHFVLRVVFVFEKCKFISTANCQTIYLFILYIITQWIADVGKQYDGLIFSLKLRCRGKQGNVLNSCVHFKKGGSCKFITVFYLYSCFSFHPFSSHSKEDLRSTLETILNNFLFSKEQTEPKQFTIKSFHLNQAPRPRISPKG